MGGSVEYTGALYLLYIIGWLCFEVEPKFFGEF